MHFKILLFASFYLSTLNAICQDQPCKLPPLMEGVTCKKPPVKGKFYTKNIVKDFGADPTGKRNSQAAFECATWFFNANGGNGTLIIPYGTYLVGNQSFISPDKHTCPYWPNYGWIGRDLVHLVDCRNLQIKGVLRKGKKPIIKYAARIKIGGFKKDGMPAENSYDTAASRYTLPSNCEASAQKDAFQACAGATFYLDNCIKISITGLEIDGNSDQYELGSFVGSGPAPYEVWSYGIVVWNTKYATLRDIFIHDAGTDGIMVKNFTDSGVETQNYHTVMDRLKILRSGRNNISWVGGNGLTVTSSILRNASVGAIKTDPGSSFDIEPEEHAKMLDRCHSMREAGKHVIVKDYCLNGYLKNNQLGGDRLYTLLNADRTDHSKDIRLVQCEVVNKTGKAYYSVKKNNIWFDNCTVNGKWRIEEVFQAPVNNDPKIRKTKFIE